MKTQNLPQTTFLSSPPPPAPNPSQATPCPQTPAVGSSHSTELSSEKFPVIHNPAYISQPREGVLLQFWQLVRCTENPGLCLRSCFWLLMVALNTDSCFGFWFHFCLCFLVTAWTPGSCRCFSTINSCFWYFTPSPDSCLHIGIANIPCALTQTDWQSPAGASPQLRLPDLNILRIIES